MAIDIRGPEGELTRAGLGIRTIADAWRHQAHGDRYTEALLTFLNTRIQNANTRRAYAFAVNELWLWLQVERRSLPTPNNIRRADAFAYSDYLQQRSLGLDEERLAMDPTRALDLRIYRYVLAHPGAGIDKIRQHLMADPQFVTSVTFQAGGRSHSLRVLDLEKSEPRGDERDAHIATFGRDPPSALDLRLACLVEHHLLRRSPTIEQIRSGVVDVSEERPERAQLDYRVDPEVFSYYVDTHTTGETARVTTVVPRLAALSSFWDFLTQTGENTSGQDALLQHNVWTAPLRDLQKRVDARKQVARALKIPSLQLVAQVLATAYNRSHGPGEAFHVAMAAIDGVDVSTAAVAEPSLYDLRDRAIILFALLVGARAEEMAHVRKSDLQPGSPAIIELLGKGSRPRLVGVPHAVMRAVADLGERLEQLASVAPSDARIHALLEPGAALFPSLKLWGRNSRDAAADATRGLSPSGFQWMLRRRAYRAGIEPGSADLARIHPHGLRHRAALLAVERQRPLPAIQATLGHASLAVTGQYVEERDPENRMLVVDEAARAQIMPEREVIEVHGEAALPDLEDDIGEDLSEDAAEQFAEPSEPGLTVPEPVSSGQPALPLVGIGEAPEEPMLLPSDRAQILAEEVESIRYLLDVYRDNWGDERRRARTKLTAAGKGALAHTYVGKRSGLLWWQGPKGEMKDPSFSYVPNAGAEAFPAMPIVSPGQFLGLDGNATCEEPLCVALSALWDRWNEDDAFGPTAAAALVSWIRVSARITIDVDDVLRKRGGYWTAFDASLDETRLTRDAAPKVAREHLDAAIVAWFERSAWQFRPSQRTRDPAGGGLEVPSWYGDVDPVAAIPTDEREQLFDWLMVFTGLPPKGRAPVFDGRSRKDVGEFMSAVCQYEMLSGDDDLGFGFGDDRKMTQQSLDILNQQLRQTVSKVTRGEVNDFDYRARRKDRKIDKTRQEMARDAAKRSESVDEQQEELRAMYSKYLAPYIMQLVGELFGPAAGKDPILSLFALCTSGAPLARESERYKNLFRVSGGAISHTSDFAREFARATGAHSECVARRLARHIYEETRAPAWAERRNWPETIDYLDAMSAYQVPCPRAQEAELRVLLGRSEPGPVYEAWRDAQRRVGAAGYPDDGETEAAAVMREHAEQRVARPTRSQTYEPNARRYLPNSALIAILALAMRR